MMLLLTSTGYAGIVTYSSNVYHDLKWRKYFSMDSRKKHYWAHAIVQLKPQPVLFSKTFFQLQWLISA